MKRYFLSFFVLISTAGLSQQKSSFPIKEGVNSTYLFFSNEALTTNNKGRIAEAVISRSINDERFREIGKLKAATTPEQFKQVAGANSLRVIQQTKGLKSEQEAWTFIQSHPKFSDYGILAADVKFMEAMGALFVDRDLQGVRPNSIIHYKAEVKSSGLDKRSTLESSIILGSKPAIEKPLVDKITESDSNIVVQWRSSANNSPDAMFGDIYRKKGNYGKYEWVGKTFANKDAKQQNLTYQWREKAQPNTQYYFVVIPTTLVGLPGPSSDTASAISKNFSTVSETNFMTVTDTTSGIILQWKPVDATYFSGMIIERSKDPKRGYTPIDTIATTASYFLDDKVLPNIQYHYRIRMVTFRQNSLSPSAMGSAIHKGVTSFIEAPEEVKAEGRKSGNYIWWKKSSDPQVSGYYVYRQHPDSSIWELVSNLVATTNFLDSSAQNSRFQYRYSVAAVNFDDIKSELSNIALARVDRPYEVIAPTGLQAAVDGQRVLLRWNDLRSNDPDVLGYNIYRKNGSENISNLSLENLKRSRFEKVNTQPLIASSFTDNSISNDSYLYAVTAIDATGSESDPSLVVPVQANNNLIVPVAEIYVRSVKTGIAISWDLPVVNNITGFSVYRRTADKNTVEKIATLNVTQTSFTDTKAQKGTLYFYTVKVMVRNTESTASGEKGIRW